MSDLFAMTDEGADPKLAQAQANSVDSLSEIDSPLFRGSFKGAGMGVMRGFAKVADALGITLGGTAGRAIDKAHELIDTGESAAKSSGNILRSIFSGQPQSLASGVPINPDTTHTEAQDAIFRKTQQIAGNAVDYWTPRANEVGRVGQVLGGLGEAGSELVAGLGSPHVLVATNTAEGGKQLVDQGVDAKTAGAAAALEGAASYAGLKVPIAGSTLLSRIATGAAGNVLLGSGTRAAEKKLLESQGYTDQAKPFTTDATAVSMDALLGALFGATHHALAPRVDPRLTPSQADAILTARNAKNFQQETAPGAPTDLRASAAHQGAMETALEQLSRGEPVDVADQVAQHQGAQFADDGRIVKNAELSRTVADSAELSDQAVSNILERPAPPEVSKEWLKANIDTRPMPDIAALQKDPRAYIEPSEQSSTVPLDRVELGKTDTQGSGDNAVKRFAAAASGEIPKRAPVELQVDENGRYHVVDGNGTVTAFRRMGLDSVVANVKPSESLLKSIDEAAPNETVGASVRKVYERAAAVKPEFDSLVRDVAKESGSPHEPLVPKALKEPARAVEKVVQDYNGDAGKLKDVVRATVVVDDLPQAQAAIDAALNRMGAPTKFRNLLEGDATTPDGYRDVNLNFKLKGHTVELQLSVPELLKAKASMHALYEERRKLAEGSGPEAVARINELNAQMRARYAEAWDAALRRMNSASEISTPPSSKGKLSVTGRPAGTSNARTVTPPSGVGSAETGTPSTLQKTGSLPSSDTGISSTSILPEDAAASKTLKQALASPELQSLRQLATQRPDAVVYTGYDENGSPVKSTLRAEYERVQQELARDIEDTKAYEAAVTCFMGHGG